MSKINLKPCPFCGGNRIEIRKSGLGWYIGCNDCSMGFSTLEKPEEFWNARPEEDRLNVEIEQLKFDNAQYLDKINGLTKKCD